MEGELNNGTDGVETDASGPAMGTGAAVADIVKQVMC